jgi:hypothetical protein
MAQHTITHCTGPSGVDHMYDFLLVQAGLIEMGATALFLFFTIGTITSGASCDRTQHSPISVLSCTASSASVALAQLTPGKLEIGEPIDTTLYNMHVNARLQRCDAGCHAKDVAQSSGNPVSLAGVDAGSCALNVGNVGNIAFAFGLSIFVLVYATAALTGIFRCTPLDVRARYS